MIDLHVLVGHVGEQGQSIVVVAGMIVLEDEVGHLHPLLVRLPVRRHPGVDRAVRFPPMTYCNLVIKSDPLLRGIMKAVFSIDVLEHAVVIALLKQKRRLTVILVVQSAIAAICVHDGDS